MEPNPIMNAPATFNGIVDAALNTVAKYRSGALDPQYYGNYANTAAAVVDTFSKAIERIRALG